MERRGTSARARIQVAGKRYEAPWRKSVSLAETDLEAMTNARDASADIAAVVATRNLLLFKVEL